MLLRMLYDEGLAQASYLIGCPASGEAVIVDPERDVERYLDLAREHELRLIAAIETHIHADFLSGVRELCALDPSIEAILPGEGGEEWAHTWPARDGVKHRFVHDGDEIRVGGVSLRAVHTPGHTPEHMSYVVHDHGAGAPTPIGVVTGDFVFVGDLGRPDLLETAAGQTGTMEASAHQLASSGVAFARLPEHLQVWPGHGSGSACGKALGAVPASTVGYEMRTNEALRLASKTDAFVASILAGQPEPPAYFGRMKTQNRDGAPILGGLPRPKTIDPKDVPKGCVVVDTRAWDTFSAGHLAGSLSMPLDRTLSTTAGSYIDPTSEVALVVEQGLCEEAVRCLVRVGIDHVAYRIDPSAMGATAAESTPQVDVREAARMLEAGEAIALDVRRKGEHDEGCVPGARHVSHVQLRPRLDDVPRDQPLLVCCRSGVRSARATSYLRSLGFDATNVVGGILAWESAGLEVDRHGAAPVSGTGA